jgi:hypothetical protein
VSGGVANIKKVAQPRVEAKPNNCQQQLFTPWQFMVATTTDISLTIFFVFQPLAFVFG